MSKFWEMPDHSSIINLDLIPIVRCDIDGAANVYLPEWDSAIYIKAEWARGFFEALMARQ